MIGLFAKSGLVSPQFWVFEAIFEVRGQYSKFVLPFILLKTTVSISRCQRKIGLKNKPPKAEIFEKKQFWLVVWFCMPFSKYTFGNILVIFSN